MFTKEHQHHIHKVVFLKSKLDKLYFHLIIQGFAASMISIFIPIFLLGLGFELSKVFIFLLVQWGSFSLFAPLVGKIIEKIGLKEVIIIRTILFVGSLVLLPLINQVPIVTNYYLVIAFLLGFSSCMYTLSITSLYANFMNLANKGHETSKFISLPQLGVLLGPIVGGLISMFYGFTTLFIFASILLVASIVQLSFVNHNLDHPKFDFKEFLSNFKKLKRTFLFLNLYGIKGFVFGLVLPISIYLINDNLGSLGLIISTITLINIGFALWLGKKIDTKTPKNIYSIGAILTSALLLALGILSSNKILLYIALIAGFIKILIDLPLEIQLYEQAKGTKSPLTFLAFKEFSFLLGRTALFLTLILLTTGIESSYYLGALSSLLFALF